MLKLVPGSVYAGITAWYIKLKTMMLKFANSSVANSHFVTVAQ